jgi:hypothetical protein
MKDRSSLEAESIPILSRTQMGTVGCRVNRHGRTLGPTGPPIFFTRALGLGLLARMRGGRSTLDRERFLYLLLSYREFFFRSVPPSSSPSSPSLSFLCLSSLLLPLSLLPPLRLPLALTSSL